MKTTVENYGTRDADNASESYSRAKPTYKKRFREPVYSFLFFQDQTQYYSLFNGQLKGIVVRKPDRVFIYVLRSRPTRKKRV